MNILYFVFIFDKSQKSSFQLLCAIDYMVYRGWFVKVKRGNVSYTICQHFLPPEPAAKVKCESSKDPKTSCCFSRLCGKPLLWSWVELKFTHMGKVACTEPTTAIQLVFGAWKAHGNATNTTFPIHQVASKGTYPYPCRTLQFSHGLVEEDFWLNSGPVLFLISLQYLSQ